MIGEYLLGSDAEAINFEPDTIGYRCAGAAHAVDPNDPVNAHAANLGYAICGTPVRIWPDQLFEPGSQDAHDRCVALTDAAGQSGSGRPINDRRRHGAA